MHKTDDPTLPPPSVLEALRRPRPKPHRLMEAETGRMAPSPLQKALATAEVLPKGDHMPPRSVLGALYWRVVRHLSSTTKRHYSPLGLHLAAQRAEAERARRVLVRRGRGVLALQPEQLGPDDEVIPPDDPYFLPKKGRPRAVVEEWRGKAPVWTID